MSNSLGTSSAGGSFVMNSHKIVCLFAATFLGVALTASASEGNSWRAATIARHAGRRMKGYVMKALYSADCDCLTGL